MTEPHLISLIVCARLTKGPPMRLIDPRRRWARPPNSFWVVADIDNPTEQSFSWQFRLTRRGQILDWSVEELEPSSPSQQLIPANVMVADAKPVIYGIDWLLNGKVAGSIDVDFGFPEASS